MHHPITLTALAISLVALAATQSLSATATVPPSSAVYRNLAKEIHSSLEHDIHSPWYPRALSAAGGFHQDYRNDWSASSSEDRSIVYQSRLSWVAAETSMRFPSERVKYRPIALHGLEILEHGLWDKEHGGFYWSVAPSGGPQSFKAINDDKQAYGISFGIYACAGIYKATHNPRALILAKRAYLWLDNHAHDAHNGGYVEALNRDGSPIGASERSGNDAIGTPYGCKSMNTHIHLLESFTALYGVWPDPLLRKRLKELLIIVRDKIATPEGYLNLEFRPDWTPTSHDDSYGHDIETAYLISEAAEALGMPHDKATWAVSKRLVDHVLHYGLDRTHGGFYDHGPANGGASGQDKIWWTQAEALNALLLMHERYGKSTDTYWNAFMQQWKFISQHQIDHQARGWFSALSPDGTPQLSRNKSDAWTDPYHQGRAMMNVEYRLEQLAIAPQIKGASR